MRRSALLATAATLFASTALPAVAAPGPLTASAITAAKPADANVTAGSKVTVTGTVTTDDGDPTRADPGSPDRTVRIELDTPRGWMQIGRSTTTNADGEYTAPVSTSWYYSGDIRATVLATDTEDTASSPTASFTVTPTYTPRGRRSSWSDLWSFAPAIRWNPCNVITYRVNAPAGSPEHAVRRVKQSFAAVTRATGFRFQYLGATTAIPWRTDGKGIEVARDADITIAWATPKQYQDLAGGVIGMGGAYGDIWDNIVTKGGIALDKTAHLKDTSGSGETVGSLLLHEMGHVFGLDHVNDRTQIMNSSISPQAPATYQAGDLAGLRFRGAMKGCTKGASPFAGPPGARTTIPVPAPAPVPDTLAR